VLLARAIVLLGRDDIGSGRMMLQRAAETGQPTSLDEETISGAVKPVSRVRLQ
jgi:hypothetical protein